MCVGWLLELVSFVAGDAEGCSFWIISDFLNSLIGVFVFLALVCDRTVIAKVRLLVYLSEVLVGQ